MTEHKALDFGPCGQQAAAERRRPNQAEDNLHIAVMSSGNRTEKDQITVKGIKQAVPNKSVTETQSSS